MNISRLSVLCLTLLCSGSMLLAQNAFVNFTSSNGLPDENVLGVAINYNNHAWFATQEGVAKYNNFTWTVYTTADGLADNFINCIAMTPMGDAWVGTDYGVSHFNGLTWTNYNTQNGLVDNMVSCIAVEQSGVVWIGTSSGVSKYSSGTFTSYTTANGLPSNMVSAIGIDTANVKWFCTWMGGVARYNDTTFTVFNTSNGLPDNNITCIAFDGSGNKYLGTYYGLAVMNAQNQWVRDIKVADGLVNDMVQAVVVDDNDRLYVGVFADYLQEGGFTVFDGSQHYIYRSTDGLVSEYIECMDIDKNGNLWVATGSGVSKFLSAQLGLGSPETSLSLEVYPNPASGAVQIAINDAQNALITVSDIHGRIVKQFAAEGESFTMDVSGLSKGLYFLSLRKEGEMNTIKLMVE